MVPIGFPIGLLVGRLKTSLYESCRPMSPAGLRIGLMTPVGLLAGFLVRLLAGFLVGLLAGLLVGLLAGFLVGLQPGTLHGFAQGLLLDSPTYVLSYF